MVCGSADEGERIKEKLVEKSRMSGAEMAKNGKNVHTRGGMVSRRGRSA